MDIQRSRYRSIIIGPDPVIPIKSNPAIEAATYPLPRARYNNTPQAAHKLCHVVLFNRSKAALNARGSVAGPSSVPIDEKLLARLKHLFVKLDPTVKPFIHLGMPARRLDVTNVWSRTMTRSPQCFMLFPLSLKNAIFFFTNSTDRRFYKRAQLSFDFLWRVFRIIHRLSFISKDILLLFVKFEIK